MIRRKETLTAAKPINANAIKARTVIGFLNVRNTFQYFLCAGFKYLKAHRISTCVQAVYFLVRPKREMFQPTQ